MRWSNSWIAVAGLAGVVVWSTTAAAVGRIWDGSSSDDWHTAANWTPSGVPTAADTLLIAGGANNAVQVNAVASFKELRFLSGSGASLTTDGSQLFYSFADHSGLLELNDGNLLVLGNNGLSTVPEIQGDLLRINSGGGLIHSGTSVLSGLDINAGGTLSGSGTVLASRNPVLGRGSIVNDGTIVAGFLAPGDLTLAAGPSGNRIDLDGTSGAGVVRATADFLFGGVGASSIRVVSPLTDAFGGLMEIGSRDRIDFDNAWSHNGELVFRGANGTDAASLGGGALDVLNFGEVRVQQGTGVMEGDATFRSGSSLTMLTGTTLRTEGAVVFQSGSVLLPTSSDNNLAFEFYGHTQILTAVDLDAAGGTNPDLYTHFDIGSRATTGKARRLEIRTPTWETDDSFQGTFINAGTLVFDDTSAVSWELGTLGELAMLSRYGDTQSAVTSVVEGDTVVVAGSAALPARITGQGEFRSNVLLNAGGELRVGQGLYYRPGQPLAEPEAGTGRMRWNGAGLTVNAGALVALELGGPNRGAAASGFDAIDATGISLNGGKLRLDLIGGYAPALYAEHVLMQHTGAGSVFGVFDVVSGVVLHGALSGTGLAVTYEGAQVLVQRALLGDANLNGQVEQGDLDAVLTNWGDNNLTSFNADVSWVTGDLNGNGIVEQGDLDAVLANWGASATPDFRGVNVPEPAMAVVLLGALAARRGRSQVAFRH